MPAEPEPGHSACEGDAGPEPAGTVRRRRAPGAALAVAGLGVGVVIFWWPCLFGKMAPLLADAQAQMLPWRAERTPPEKPRWDALLWDGMAQYYPWRSFATRMARRGLVPLWNPHEFCGTPFVANGQSAFFYPPNWLFFIVDTRYAFGLLAAIHYLLAGLFVFLLGRELGLSSGAAVTGAVAFMFGGFIVAWTELPTLMNSAVWLPAAAWAIERSFRRPSVTGPVWLAVALAMTLLAGHLQIAAYVWLTAGAHLAARAVWALCRARRGVVPASALLHCVMAFGVAACLAAIQLLPTLELAKMSSRGGVRADEAGFQFRAERALKPVMLTTFALPDSLGTPREWAEHGLPYSETCGYVGKLTLLLALIGLLGVRSRPAVFLASLALVAVNAASGGVAARGLYYHVPGMAQAGGFARILCVYTFAVAVLAALGVDRLAQWCARAPASAGFVPRLAPWVGAVAAALIFVDLLAWGRGFLPLSPRERVYPPSPVVERLRALPQGERVLAVTHRDNWRLERVPDAVLPPNSACAYGYDSVQGYDSLRLAIYDGLAGKINPQGFSPIANGNMVLLDNLDASALDEAAVSLVVVAETEPLSGQRFRERWRGSGVILYQNMHAAPRLHYEPSRPLGFDALWVPSEPVGDPATIRAAVLSPAVEGLTVADSYYPGWHASADGREALVRLLPPMFKEVPLPHGTKHVELVYAPASFQVGAFVSLVALALIGGCLTFAQAQRRRAGVE